jgi:hypothetical protein
MTIRWRSKSLNFFGLLALLLTSSANSGRESIYYRSQKDADTALAAFDQANPDCQLWTNWQKMCSRTGDGGATICALDPAFTVEPSIPFCAEVSSKTRASFRLSKLFGTEVTSQSRSRGRYCQMKGPILNCRMERPFNGAHLTARRHAVCETWAESRAPAFRSVCSEVAITGKIPSCSSSALKKFKSTSALYCSKKKSYIEKGICENISGQGEGPDFDHQGAYETLAIGRRGDSAVVGLYCD